MVAVELHILDEEALRKALAEVVVHRAKAHKPAAVAAGAVAVEEGHIGLAVEAVAVLASLPAAVQLVALQWADEARRLAVPAEQRPVAASSPEVAEAVVAVAEAGQHWPVAVRSAAEFVVAAALPAGFAGVVVEAETMEIEYLAFIYSSNPC